jgi:hypothetical protein
VEWAEEEYRDNKKLATGIFPILKPIHKKTCANTLKINNTIINKQLKIKKKWEKE